MSIRYGIVHQQARRRRMTQLSGRPLTPQDVLFTAHGPFNDGSGPRVNAYP